MDGQIALRDSNSQIRLAPVDLGRPDLRKPRKLGNVADHSRITVLERKNLFGPAADRSASISPPQTLAPVTLLPGWWTIGR